MNKMTNITRWMRLAMTLAVMMLTTMTAWAQDEISEKLSVTTQFFLDDMKKGGERGGKKGDVQEEQQNMLYASPVTIDGRNYISCFLRLKDNTDTKELEKLGVIVQCRFDKGIITANVPVDALMDVAKLANVNHVNVASTMNISTHIARVKTHTDDVLTYSNDARLAGLTKGYDGTGVLIGVIDTGIDFQHIAFKDKNGNSRIVGAYISNNTYNSGQEFTTPEEIAHLTTDDENENHGTHTASTAGGSSVIVTKDNENFDVVTVTDDHANATYGGMAPGASLYLAGVKGLYNTFLANATQKIVKYADDHGMPLVVNNSWGSQESPHDGTGYMADIYNQYFGDDHPNHIALFAASNDAGFRVNNEEGGCHVLGTISATTPLGTIVRSKNGGNNYANTLVSAWTRSTDIGNLTATVHVLDTSTGEVKKSVTVNTSNTTTTISDFSTYFDGDLKVAFEHNTAGKKRVVLFTSKLTPTEAGTNCTLAIEIALANGTEGSTKIDFWGAPSCYFTGNLTTDGHTWTAGSDDMSVSDDAMIASVIPVGAYISSRSFTNYLGRYLTYNMLTTNDDIAPFSSYATAAESPTGLQYPWITAPGAALVGAVSCYSDHYRGNDQLVVNSKYPYAMMMGTSQATPVAAGIVALWLQYAKENNKTLTVNQVKEIMRKTAIHDSYTAGANASHFGNGKINALGGFVSEWPGTYYNLSNNGDNFATISDAKNSQSAYVVLNQRTLYKDNAWNTLCLPFDVSDGNTDDNITFTGTPLEGATVMELDNATTGYAHATGLEEDGTLYLNFKPVTTITAGTPYIIKWEGENLADLVDPAFSNISVTATSPAEVLFTGGKFVGTYAGQKFTDTNTNILFLGDDNSLYYPEKDAIIGAQRAYFDLSQPAGARRFVLNFEDETTGIGSVESLEFRVESEGWYTLTGVKLEGKPTEKGVYINNGKKMVIK